MEAHALSAQIRIWASELGFDACRIVLTQVAPHWSFFEYWLERGNAGSMGYLHRGAAARQHPGTLAGAELPLHSLVVLAVDYRQFELDGALLNDPARGIIASYAWGEDYHELIRPQLIELDRRIRAASGRQWPGKAFVDAGPVLERDFAEASGMAFTGKNCMSITPGVGSQFFLATLSVPELLAPDPLPAATAPTVAPEQVLAGLPWQALLGKRVLVDENGRSRNATCGACQRCLVACPTQAFMGPFHLDARRCIAYWTIETQELAPVELLPGFQNRIFGCDICQEVCPWNHRLAPREVRLPGLLAREQWIAPPLLEGFAIDTPYWLDADAFAERFRRSPIKRAKRAGMLRNVCVALGNWGAAEAHAALALAATDRAPAVQAAVQWARTRLSDASGDLH
jgi:epoxyqueuosine reductase